MLQSSYNTFAGCFYYMTIFLDPRPSSYSILFFKFLAAPTKTNEKISKWKMRRMKLKLKKQQLKSAENSSSLMSELPFALTSPTTWKELGCMYILPAN